MPTIEVATLADSERARVQGSTQLLSEWLALHRRGLPAYHNLRLGMTPQSAPGLNLEPAVERMLRRHNRYADAVVITPGAVEIYEAKPVADPAAISQVRLYSRLAQSTPELAPYIDRGVRPIVVFGTHDAEVSREASSLGVEVVTYAPPWLGDYLASAYFRARQSRRASA